MSGRPICDPEIEEFYATLFPWQTMSAEEYAARHSHHIGVFSIDREKFSNAQLDEWIMQLGSILRSADMARKCRRKYLSPVECADIENFPGGFD